ncbi:hypothetical protein VNI00_004993 [Paramarasmius palmivorus]|uniref:Metallo-beta-lactamase domain-containing protein n=1 Tax=Paramarasmius palmivorus TaxID=297713 RepID=A0AAW0DK21_9AGAR
MSPSNFQSSLKITHVGTATAIIDIDGVTFLTDPVFAGAGAEYPVLPGFSLKSLDGPAVKLNELPPIDAVLLSHEDHPDNLDEVGRTLLEGRQVFTTPDGAKKLSPRPGVKALQPWETVSADIGGKPFKITGIPCQHLPGGEVVGFILESPSFGTHSDGLPNAIYFSGDTVYFEELKEMKKKWHIVVALLNLGVAAVPTPNGNLLITMGGQDAVNFTRDLGVDVVVPMHFESWTHFSEKVDELRQIFDAEKDVGDKVAWLTPGVPKKLF